MSAIEFRKAKTLDWEFCANGCRGGSSKTADRGPSMGQICVFVMGRPVGGAPEDSFFCPSCVKEMKATWERRGLSVEDDALREREEADQDWTRAVDEPVAA